MLTIRHFPLSTVLGLLFAVDILRMLHHAVYAFKIVGLDIHAPGFCRVKTPNYELYGAMTVDIRVNISGEGWTVNKIQFNYFANTSAKNCLAYGPGLLPQVNDQAPACRLQRLRPCSLQESVLCALFVTVRPIRCLCTQLEHLDACRVRSLEWRCRSSSKPRIPAITSVAVVGTCSQ